METTPLLSATSNNQQERDKSPAPSYGTTDSCTNSSPPVYSDVDFPPPYTRRDADEALRSWLYPYSATIIDVAEIELHAIRVQDRRGRYSGRRKYDVENVEERDTEAELQTCKSVCVALTAFIVLLVLSM
jgi:hypothetical protein